MKSYILILFFVLISGILSAETIKDAEKLFQEGHYAEASQLYQTLLSANPTDVNLNIRLGRTFLMLNQPEQALRYLQYAKSRRMLRADLYLGECYHLLYRFDDALSCFHAYESVAQSEEDKQWLNEAIARAELGKHMLESVEDVMIRDSFYLPDSMFLSAYQLSEDYGEVLSLQTLFGSRFPSNIFAYQSGRKDRIILAYDEEQSGQTDLMIAYRLADDWTKATALSSVINSPKSENYPFMMPDGVMLYFASQGHSNLGGYDIFVSRYNSSTDDYSQPKNIGMPFNSPYNDYLLVIDEMKQTGWFVTDRFQPKGQVVVYEFVPNNEKIILSGLDPDALLNRAKLKEKHAAVGVSHRDVEVRADDGETELYDSIYFVVFDGLIYYDMNQFQSSEAQELFEESRRVEQKLKTSLILLQGKRRELYVSDHPEDNKHLSESIMKLEQDVQTYQELLDSLILRTRKLEQEAVHI